MIILVSVSAEKQMALRSNQEQLSFIELYLLADFQKFMVGQQESFV
ncbi:hypothetical protein [Marinobacter sp.]